MYRIFFGILFLLTSTLHSYEIPICCYDNGLAYWRGIYFSGLVGQGKSHEQSKFQNANYFNTLGPAVLGSKFHFDSKKIIGGGAIGYNGQQDCMVIGLEAGALSLQLNETKASPFFPDSDRYTSQLNWVGNVKLRMGFAYKRFLAFATGGWAGSNLDLTLRDTTSNIVARSKKWVNGWTVGGGLEFRLSRCFSLGFNYDYIQFQYSTRMSCPNCGEGVGLGTPRISRCLNVHTLLFRLNYIYNL